MCVCWGCEVVAVECKASKRTGDRGNIGGGGRVEAETSTAGQEKDEIVA